jgi:hypothetical protein
VTADTFYQSIGMPNNGGVIRCARSARSPAVA